ncbi:MAG TPA: HD domain-containing phosphohydrolase [Spirochaetia bacterium]|nr:HD domain-containing phosphohydrolase [Spirochaetia bacterium]
MQSIKLTELKPGMIFTKPVYIDGVNLLVPENVPIKEKDLERLKRWNIEEVTTDGQVTTEKSAPVASQSVLQNAVVGEGQREIMATYAKLASRLAGVHSSVKRQQSIDTSEIDGVVDTLFTAIRSDKNNMIQYILYGLQDESGFVENALNSAVLATLVGMNMNMVQHRLLQLTTGALLHDIGMLRLPDAIVSKRTELAREERQQIATHPVHSYKIITREMKYPEEIGLIALQHQERWDGEGYPKGLSGKDIVIPARIVAVTDSFEAMVSNRPYRNSMIGYAAMRAILSDNARRFDPAVLKIFIRTMGIYPIGSVVLLSNSCIGRVVETNPESPLRPQIKIMIDQSGVEYKKDEGEVVDLMHEKKVFIARAVDPKESGERSEPSRE